MVDLTRAVGGGYAGTCRVLALLAGALAVALVLPVCAVAYVIPESLEAAKYDKVCPPRPADPPEGATASEIDLVTIAQEIADSCYRAEQRLEETHADSEAVKTAVAEVGAKLVAPIKTVVEGEPSVKVANLSEQPTGGTVELSSEAKAAVDNSALNAGFVVGGFLIGLVLAGAIWLMLRPGQ
ncbi:MAG TPA: hypothetical protein VGP17_10790 [Solirubrobacteraceae bacterium]|jgi:hypothetical protein|nr:hypothetical protein [Solirubrobacteraceae bacterium]